MAFYELPLVGEDSHDEYAEYLQKDEVRYKELIQFVEEFLQSEEFYWKNVCKNEDDAQSKEIAHVELSISIPRYTLTSRAKRLWATERQFEKYVKNKEVKGITKHQEEQIAIIREKIADAKNRYLCHKEERKFLRETKRKAVLEELNKLYYLSANALSTKSKLIDYVLIRFKTQHAKKRKKKGRTIAIIKKLAMEAKRQKQINEIKSRRYNTKSVRREKLIKGLEIFGAKLNLLPKPEPEPETKSEHESQIAEEYDWTNLNKIKNEQLNEIKKSEDDINMKDEDEEDQILPYVPVINDRLKIKADKDSKLIELVLEFKKLNPILKERQKFLQEKQVILGHTFQNDSNFSWSPNMIEFEGFKNGRIYKKKLTILNSGTVDKRCRFYTIKFEEFDPTLIHVQPEPIQNLPPGLSFTVTITFTPKTLTKVVTGHIVFVTYEPNHNYYLQVSIPFLCVPLYSKIIIVPPEIRFDTLPIWEAEEICNYKNYRKLKMYNKGSKPCKIVITKIRNQFESIMNTSSELRIASEINQADILERLSKISDTKEGDTPNNQQVEDYEHFLLNTEILMKEVLEQCLHDVFNSFTFDTYCFDINPQGKKEINVYFKNIDHVGNYYEKYLVGIFEEFDEKVLDCIGSQVLPVQAELTGKFIEAVPDVLDFGGCVFNSVYSLNVKIHNTDKSAHIVGIKFPSSLKNYLSSSENNINIRPDISETIALKFFPRKEIIEIEKLKYYDPSTGILEFPIYVYLTSKNLQQTPPTKITIFAVLTDSNYLTITPAEKSYSSYLSDTSETSCNSSVSCMLDLGECTIAETVHTELELKNNSQVFQNFGFLDLPRYIKILPNYGFGQISPLENQKLTLIFTPEARDIPDYDLKCEEANNILLFPISVNTIKNLGGVEKIQKPFHLKYIKKSLEITEKEIDRKVSTALLQDMYELLDLVQEETSTYTLPEESNVSLSADSEKLILVTELNGEQLADEFTQTEIPVVEKISDEAEISGEAEISTDVDTSERLRRANNKLWIKATIIDPLCDLSHHHIEFPDTPCGSYSIMAIDLKALAKVGDFNCTCGFVKKFSRCKKHLQFIAHFEIVGDNPEISIEPICGDLQSGDKIKLTLVAKPELTEETIMQTAREIKIQELQELKRKEWEIKLQKKLAATSAKDKKTAKSAKGKKESTAKSAKGKKESAGKSAKDKKENKKEQDDVEELPEPVPYFPIDETEIVTNYLDLCPAEMAAWKNLKPYFIKAHFCCTVTYNSSEIIRKSEKLYFNAVCKVIKPDFTHNLNTQHMNFGPTVIGAISRKIVSIQNIQDKTINPMVTLLSPTGCFKCITPGNLQVLPEHTHGLPIKFTPYKEETVAEYFEIRAGSTIYPLIVSGEGVEPNFKITPEFVVCRLEAKTGAFSDCSLEINNQCKAAIIIEFVKTCEIEGEIKPLEEKPSEPIPKDKTGKDSAKSKTAKDKKGKGSAKSKKSKGKDSVKSKKTSKFSMTLTDEEEVSLNNYFTNKKGESYFEIFGGIGNTVNVDSLSKKSIKIRFGVPLPKDTNKTGKGGDLKGTKNAKNSGKGGSPKGTKDSKKSSKGGKKLEGPQIYYVAKYNIMLGPTFLRDAIIIATFI